MDYPVLILSTWNMASELWAAIEMIQTLVRPHSRYSRVDNAFDKVALALWESPISTLVCV